MKKIAGLILLLVVINAKASSCIEDKFRYPFYVGFTGGYGATTWRGLVPAPDKQNDALAMSTPTNVVEGGGVWGFIAGYDLIPNFGIEGGYTRYPDATVTFDPMSLFTYEHNNLTSLTTHTETYSIIGKIMFVIPHTPGIRLYSSIGAADIHRYDMLVNRNHVSPTFGAGLNYNFTDHIMGEIGANYTAGYGQPELSPVQDYMPFLYSAFLKVAYRF